MWAHTVSPASEQHSIQLLLPTPVHREDRHLINSNVGFYLAVVWPVSREPEDKGDRLEKKESLVHNSCLFSWNTRCFGHCMHYSWIPLDFSNPSFVQRERHPRLCKVGWMISTAAGVTGCRDKTRKKCQKHKFRRKAQVPE